MTLPQQANGKGPATPQRKRPGIVIVGGGAGGLELATRSAIALAASRRPILS